MHTMASNGRPNPPTKQRTWMVFRKLRGSAGSSKGYAPTSMTYSVTPQLHTSAGCPLYSLRCSTSGAM